MDISLIHHPQAGAELAGSLPALFRERLSRPDDLPSWRMSRLTPDGYPFELTFTTLRDGVRCTFEAFPRELTPSARVAHAVQLLKPYGEFDPELLAMIVQAQHDEPLRFGAWIGVRHVDGRLEHKLYAEMPASRPERAQAITDRLLQRTLCTTRRPTRLTMIGLLLQRHVVEFYWSVTGVRPWELTTLLAPVGLQLRTEAVMSHLELAYGTALHQQFPGPVFGYSHSVPLSALQSSQFTFFAMAEMMFGSGAATRGRLMRYFDAVGVDMSYYAEVSQPQAQARKANLHGIFGLTVSASGPVVATIGLRPPDA